MVIGKQIKITPKKISRWLTMATIALSVIILISVSSFLYNNFYQTITQSKEVLVLREKVALSTIDMEKFNVIINKLKKKIISKELSNIYNPF
ncbi:MAG: hypothetical protein PHS62_01130 [Patescibacteria group bacterium]|nr:hypothetical protein [Patescibacteria group bacterium]